MPGATMSGLIRRSLVGPRLLKAAIQLGLFAMRSANSGLCGKEPGRIPPQVCNSVGRSFSLAPTVMQFFAAACDPTCPSSTMPSLFVSIPSLPAAKQTTQSGWLNTKSSISFELCVYGNPGVTSPQEFVCTRALSLNAGPNRSCSSW